MQGGTVNGKSAIDINAGSSAIIAVSNDNMLNANDCNGGMFTNNGVVGLSAGAQLAGGVHRPVSVAGMMGGPEQPFQWDGTGTYEAIGGVWDSTDHTFTVSSALQTSAGATTPIDLSTNERLTIGNDLEVNFAAGSATFDFTADRTSADTRAGPHLPLTVSAATT